MDKLAIPPELVGEAFKKDRWGGTLLVNLCGYGETLAQKDIVEITYEILKQGHFINITNNGTISKKIDEFLAFPNEFQSRLCFAFSLHYVELKSKGLLDVFAENVNKIKRSSCSFLVQLNLCDNYIKLEKEIKDYCLKSFGALPQLALTRKEEINGRYSLFTNFNERDYYEYGRTYFSPLFDFTYKNFNVKRKEFCYAGKWSYKLDLATGDLKSCYFSDSFFNIYKDLNKKIPELAVGHNCGCKYCINSSHFMSLGIIPSIQTPTYGFLRNRIDGHWYKDRFLNFVNQKLFDNNPQYSFIKRFFADIRFKKILLHKRIERKLKK